MGAEPWVCVGRVWNEFNSKLTAQLLGGEKKHKNNNDTDRIIISDAATNKMPISKCPTHESQNQSIIGI